MGAVLPPRTYASRVHVNLLCTRPVDRSRAHTPCYGPRHGIIFPATAVTHACADGPCEQRPESLRRVGRVAQQQALETVTEAVACRPRLLRRLGKARGMAMHCSGSSRKRSGGSSIWGGCSWRLCGRRKQQAATGHAGGECRRVPQPVHACGSSC